jgi:hypothetical protein
MEVSFGAPVVSHAAQKVCSLLSELTFVWRGRSLLFLQGSGALVAAKRVLIVVEIQEKVTGSILSGG